MALFAVLSLMATGCQKDNIKKNNSTTVREEVSTVYTMLYSINGVQHSVTLHGESEYQAFIHEMLNLARQGYSIVFCDENRVSQTATKETVYFTTNSQVEAELWAKARSDEGYQVAISYDDKNHVFNCVAWR